MTRNQPLSSRLLQLVWKQRFATFSIAAHFFAFLCVTIALLLNFAVVAPSFQIAPFAFFFPAVLVAAIAGGVFAGVTATILGGVAVWMFLLPEGVFIVSETTKVVGIAVYAATSLFLLLLVGLMRLAAEQLDASKERAQDEHDRLVAALEASGAGTWRWDIQNDIVEWDEALCQVYGLDPKDAPRNSAAFLELVHPDDRERAGEVIRRCIEEGVPAEYEFRAVVPKGTLHIYDRSRLVRDAAGRPAFMLGACLDVTARRRAEEEQGRVSTWLEMAMEVAQIGTWEIDPKNGTVIGSDIMNAIFGLPADGQSRPFKEYLALVHPDDAAMVEQAIARRAETNEPVSVEYRLVRPNGEIRWLASRGAFARRSDGSARIVGSLLDITERKRIEEEREATLRQRELMLREINHRVKNNLQMVSSLLNLQAGRMADPAVKEHFRKAVDRVQAVGDIHARLYQGEQLGRIDFDTYLESLCNRLRESMLEGRKIELALEAEAVSLDIDRAIPLGLIVNELVTNAIKHAFTGDAAGSIHVDLRKGGNGETLRLSVRDTGSGVPAEGVQNGLGSRLIEGLMQQVDGTIERSVNGGTRFDIVLREPSHEIAASKGN